MDEILITAIEYFSILTIDRKEFKQGTQADKSKVNRWSVVGTGGKLESPWREKLMFVTPTRDRCRGTMFRGIVTLLIDVYRIVRSLEACYTVYV